jgi:periplasmic divalent cation tolerance protein
LVRGVQVQFAIDDVAQGNAIVVDLLTKRLIACAQTIGPMTSRYWWRGSINDAPEWLFLCKTTPERLDDVIECIRIRHSYETPEIVACEITGGLEAYVDWIVAETQPLPNGAESD